MALDFQCRGLKILPIHSASLLPTIFSFSQFRSESPDFRPDHHFSSVYLQKIKISQKYAINKHEKSKIV